MRVIRYRKLDASGDYAFGQQQANFYRDEPRAVAQAVTTRLRLQLGDWFLDITDGMNWKGGVLGNRTGFVRDAAIRTRVLTTVGVTEITGYNSSANPNTRAFRANFSMDTIYGPFGYTPQQYLVPVDITAPRIPAVPTGVAVNVLNDTQADVTWQEG